MLILVVDVLRKLLDSLIEKYILNLYYDLKSGG